MRRALVALTTAGVLGLASLTGTAGAQTINVNAIGTAQRVAQGIEHFDPYDRLFTEMATNYAAMFPGIEVNKAMRCCSARPAASTTPTAGP
jgi:hypothetical protein